MLTTETITIQVTPEIANAFRSASETDRRKMELLLNLRLLEVTRARKPLEQIMREISRSAKERGLMEDKLKELLAD
ncbi:MAG: hypothetical protein JETCAE02_14500 [Anaerolineaceae bacterium]|nr:hypothetical protein [Anaerolineales bacterium]WKZ54500.1 MAG: hypothetical protein QY324_00440 [Anaerolineales bacterium]GIK09440.1 MAG: hypothetical protein BroJett001_15060 [Chloroflexota bacterium]GJQ39038.1 MAG: hypothetical protein JETCAE02_14500 [Anaerolineaceae bacterium]HMM98847.1 hypothetical protein [Anaerolineales bacterium]